MIAWGTIINEVFTVVLIPLLGLITKYLIEFLHAKREEAKGKTDNEKLKKYIDMVDATITRAVIATNQTYVNTLKEKGEFGPEAQKEALQKTYQAVMAVLNLEAVAYLEEAVGDLQSYILTGIEAAVNTQKLVVNTAPELPATPVE